MEVAKEGCYGFGNQTFFHIKDSQKDAIDAALEAKELIDTVHVQAIIGPHTWEEVSLVAEIARETQVPILSFSDTAPEWATERWPSLLQASPDKNVQMKAIAAIVQSWNLHQVTAIYEDTDSSVRGVIPHLHDALREVNSEVRQFVSLSPFASSDSISKELENIKNKNCRVFVVHLSFKLAVRLFEMTKKMEMMEKDYLWITTDPFTSLVHSINASVLSSMQGVLGVRSYFLKMGPDFEDFNQRFRTSFSRKYPQEEQRGPGIYAVQAYDSMRTIALALNKNGSKRGGKELLENILDTDFHGLSGKVKFKNQKVASAEIFQIVNVIGMSYNELGYWSHGVGFSENIDGNKSKSMIDLGQVNWPGGPRDDPNGWTTLRIGVPSSSGYKEYVNVENDGPSGKNFSGFTIEVFKETIKRIPFFPSYDFYGFDGDYNELVEQIHLKKFDAVVGDVDIVASRYQDAEFTSPYTETGLVLIVPARSSSKAWSFIKPFTTTMWVLISVFTVYNGFVVWWIERKSCDELQGSIPNQIGIMLWLSYNTLLSLNAPTLHSNLSRMSGVAFPRGSPLLASVNEALLKITENGKVQALEKKWITPEKCPEIQSESSSLGPNGFLVLFYITGGTTTAAFVIYVCRTNLSRDRKIWRTISAVPKRWCSLRTPFTTRVASAEIPTHTFPEAPVPPASI
ncbi:hypothetical protein OIU76_019461 [Salix suchowensis]|nr:hypothetical protein OIU76_019461 [Salix suchowensis]